MKNETKTAIQSLTQHEEPSPACPASLFGEQRMSVPRHVPFGRVIPYSDNIADKINGWDFILRRKNNPEVSGSVVLVSAI